MEAQDDLGRKFGFINPMGKLSPSFFPFPHGGISDFFLEWTILILNFILKPKNARFGIFVGDMMYHFVSYSMLNQ